MSTEEKNKYIQLADQVVCDEEKKNNFYDKLRKRFTKKKHDNHKTGPLDIKDFFFLLPDIFILMTRLIVDKNVNKNHKVMISCIIGYIIMPLDLIPDFIPWIGFLDDLIISVLGINYLINEIDNKIILDNWPGKDNLIETIKMLNHNIENTVQTFWMKKIKRLFGIFHGLTLKNTKLNHKENNEE